MEIKKSGLLRQEIRKEEIISLLFKLDAPLAQPDRATAFSNWGLIWETI
jgi:hypothetical protein